MAAIASDDWLEALVAVAPGVPPTPGVSGTVSVTVESSPEGKVGWTETLVDGVTVAAQPKASKDADIVLTAKFPELIAMMDGDSNPAVMFMQGRLKLSGDTGKFIELLPALQTPEAAAARAELAATTDR